MKKALLALACTLVLSGAAVQADTPPPGGHPHYLEAKGDLQAADALLQMPDDNQNIVNDQKRVEVSVHNAIGDCRHAAWWHDEPTRYTPAPDVRMGPGRLREIDRLLHQALDDLQAPEEGARPAGWQQKAAHHVQEAIGSFAQVMTDAHLDLGEAREAH